MSRMQQFSCAMGTMCLFSPVEIEKLSLNTLVELGYEMGIQSTAAMLINFFVQLTRLYQPQPVTVGQTGVVS